MSKFIQTQCGSLVNVDSISSIQKWHTEINDCVFKIDIVIINNKNQEFIYNSSMFYCSKKDTDDYIHSDNFCNDTFQEIKDYFISRDVNIILKSNIDSNNINLWRVKQ